MEPFSPHGWHAPVEVAWQAQGKGSKKQCDDQRQLLDQEFAFEASCFDTLIA